ncbi:MAG: NYN domain-containing protein [Chloroflexi bacterium]|nr:NYN domain-containing protein [Chloroflexota bacterium]
MANLKTNVYVDGFNFYYGCIRGTPWRWLDLEILCRLLLPSHEINRIRYFTALVNARPDDPNQPQRQQTYLRALRTLPSVSLHFGHFLSNETNMRLARPPATGPRNVAVIKTEEKGSDVNLATFLLVDAFDHDCDQAVIISNDSDLLTPIQFVRELFGVRVGIFNPQKNRSWTLFNAVDFYRPIRKGPLSASQFPTSLSDTNGNFTKPQGW